MFNRKKQDAEPTAAEWEEQATACFRSADRTGNATDRAHGQHAMLHAERVRRGLVSIEQLPADVLQKSGWASVSRTLSGR